MPLFSSTQPSIRARIIPRFPAQVLAGNGMIITKNGSQYIFSTAAYADIPLTALADIQTNRILGRDAAGAGPPQEITVSGGLGLTGSGQLQLTPNQRLRGTVAQFVTPVANAKFDMFIPVSCTIKGVTLLGDVTGSCVVDIWKSTFASFPPTNVNSICSGAKPTIVSGVKFRDTTLTGWSTGVLSGDILRVNLDSVSGFTRLSICVDAETL